MLGDYLGDSVFKETRKSFLSRDAKSSPGLDGFGRLVLLQLFVTFVFLFLFATLVKTQIFAGPYYRDLANNNRVREIPIHAPRGIIFDRNGTALTANIPAFRLDDQVISKDQAITLETQGKNPEVDSARSYLDGPAFAHVLGYVDDNGGQGGVESFYDDKLRGIDGKELVEVDATGAKLRTISAISPTPGQNINLTIDATLQKTVLGAIGGKKAAVVVTNPNTGEILALVSSPTFNPNLFTDFSLPLEERTAGINAIFADKNLPLFDRSIGGAYPPGSTFKIVTATAGLETGAIKADTIIEDTGVLVIGPYKFPNWKWLRDGGVEGNLDVVGGIQKSNDIFFYKTGEMTGIDPLMTWARKFGLGSRLGIDLPGEATGLVPDAAWRKANIRSWYLGDTYHVAIGQGDLLVTPIQDNAWTNVIASGGKLCTPHVVTQLPGNPVTQCKNLGIKPETINLIQKGMVAACTPGGTGYPLFNYQNPKTKTLIQIACKTGTAEFGVDTVTGLPTHAWFTSYGPANQPEISVTVLIEGGGEGSDVAAPVAKLIYDAWFGR